MSGDPIQDYHRREAEYEKFLTNSPQCCLCGQPITDEYLYDIFDALYCEDCMKKNYRKSTDLYVRED